MRNKLLNIAVVGLGGMGTVHISNYEHIDNVKVVAVCDTTESGKEKAASLGVSFYEDLDQLLQNEDIDIVDICTPTFLHPKHVTTALKSGKHVICEKPLALSKKDGADMFALAREKQVQIHVAQVVQYAKETEVLRNLVESEEYGKPLDAQFLRLSARPQWVKGGWLFDQKRSGLLPFDLHIHDLDLIVSLFGVPKTVSYTSCGNKDRDYKEHYRFAYGYDNLNISAEAAWYNADFPFTATWRVYFENAVVTNDKNGVVAYRFDHEPKVFDTSEKVKIPTGINVPPTGIYLAELSDFICQIRLDKPNLKREKEILAVLEILESIK